jgi:sugar lactone lactonase YvrE
MDTLKSSVGVRRLLRATAVVATTLTLVAAAGAAPAAAHGHGSRFPDVIALPDGFLPEGIAIGPGPYAYLGSRADGRVLRVDLATGKLTDPVSGPLGAPSVGLKTDARGRLFVAGGPAGSGRVIDVKAGKILKSYLFAAAPTFVNDVVLTHGAAYFTDSRRPVLYKVALGKRGVLPDTFETLTLSGDYVHDPTPNVNNLNGIAQTPDGRALIVVQSSTGKLFRADPATGVTKEVDAGGYVFTNGDGLLTLGRDLYVVQNRLNKVAKVQLNRSGTAGTVTGQYTDPDFDVPTTVAAFGRRLYLPNARFNSPQTPETTFTLVAIPRS